MKTFINNNERFGWEGPFEAMSKEDLADEMMPTLRDWADEGHGTVEELRNEFISGLEETK